MLTLTRVDLDTQTCSAPGCQCTAIHGPLVLRARCHPKAALAVSYHDGVLTVQCFTCHRPVAAIVVAAGEEATAPC